MVNFADTFDNLGKFVLYFLLEGEEILRKLGEKS